MIHDVAIIGAGPCGLAVAARLREPLPSALFTDIEHARFWGRSHDKNTVDNENRKRKSPSTNQPGTNSTTSIIVFDTHSDQWMSSWRSRFRALKISHLRSPLFFHPDPQDRDGLLAFAHFEGREAELREIQNVVGREMSKHKRKKSRKTRNGQHQSARHLEIDNRDKNDYFTPSTPLFDSYIDSIVERYDLKDLIQHTAIKDVAHDYIESANTRLFTLTTPAGLKYHSRIVIIATGPANIPHVPPNCPLLKHPNSNGSASHIFNFTKPLLPSHTTHKLTTRTPVEIMVIGGGLTSGQIVDLLLSTHRAIQKVHLVLRSKLKSKHFDVDLPWVAKLRNREMATFWSADTDEERFVMLKAARGGGSVTPTYEKILREWCRRGKLDVHSRYEIAEGTTWNHELKVWDVALRPSDGRCEDEEGKVVASIDHIIFATSTPPNVANVPCLASLRKAAPIPAINGLPVLTQDLAWSEDIPLFMTGALAGLRLGPGAGNLAGARLGAERIAWAVDEILKDERGLGETVRRDSGYDSEDGVEGKKSLRRAYNAGLGNQFAGLALLDD